jgi:proteasome lid subunit RPN8/RPN11
MQVEVSSALIEQMLVQAQAAHPLEACGILLGLGTRIETIQLCTNVHPEPARHFEIDTQALFDAHRAARGGGPEVVGYWHSHPSGLPEPSAVDRAHATGDGRVWAIVGEGIVGWWRDAPEGFEPLSYSVQAR